jgi:hypothetical protein
VGRTGCFSGNKKSFVLLATGTQEVVGVYWIVTHTLIPCCFLDHFKENTELENKEKQESTA